MEETPDTRLRVLADDLRERLHVIGNHSLRDRDPGGHLAELRRVSEKIDRRRSELSADMDPRLNHFLEGCSYAKALDWIETHLSGNHTTPHT